MPLGIANLGNTCYMNAALQCGILACEPLLAYFQSEEYVSDLTVPFPDSLTKAIAWLINEQSNPDNRHTIYPTMVKTAIDLKMSRFKGTAQHDCSEFLIHLLDQLHVELGLKQSSIKRASSSAMLMRSSSLLQTLNGGISGRNAKSINWQVKGDQWWAGHRSKEDSPIRRLYEGAIRSVMTCTVCSGVSARFETFTSLILPIGSDGDIPTARAQFALTDLFDELLKPEIIHGIDCDYCRRKQSFNRTLDIWRLPPFLILTIGRFSYDYSTGRKMNNFVDFPIDNLPLDEYVPVEAPLQEFTNYKLYAVVEHEGTLNRGHYTAIVKKGNDWLNANDARISNCNQICSNNAYMLFYKWS